MIILGIEILIAIFALANGIVCLRNPQAAIHIQQRFYAKINWKLEPIDLAKELRNTRIMGAISILLSIFLTLVLLLKT